MNFRLTLPMLALLCFLPLSLVAKATIATPPKNFEAVYKAKYHGISVTATRSLRTAPDGSKVYEFEAESWIADLKETSVFRWSQNDRIVPIRYRYERTGLGRDREAVLDFDWATNTVINNVERKPWKMEVPLLALDKLSYQLQIRADLINERPLLEYKIADGGRIKEYSFEVLGEEEIDTDAGRFKAVKVKRVRENEDRQTVFWMAKDWDYLIVRLQQVEDDGASYEIDLNRATLDGKPVEGY
ncbi:DUF3108 domain-containing protein [Proteobacteria bacterium 005FR1]|nr:DUF3108 domain-containing protein [Proteobacteria bacterium 005FR1]